MVRKMVHPRYFFSRVILAFSQWNQGYKNSIVIDFPGFSIGWWNKVDTMTSPDTMLPRSMIWREAHWGSKLFCNLLFLHFKESFGSSAIMDSHGSWKWQYERLFVFQCPNLNPPPFQWSYPKMPWKPRKSSSMRNFFFTNFSIHAGHDRWSFARRSFGEALRWNMDHFCMELPFFGIGDISSFQPVLRVYWWAPVNRIL